MKKASELVSKQCSINDEIINLFFIFSALLDLASSHLAIHYFFRSSKNNFFCFIDFWDFYGRSVSGHKTESLIFDLWQRLLFVLFQSCNWWNRDVVMAEIRVDFKERKKRGNANFVDGWCQIQLKCYPQGVLWIIQLQLWFNHNFHFFFYKKFLKLLRVEKDKKNFSDNDSWTNEIGFFKKICFKFKKLNG